MHQANLQKHQQGAIPIPILVALIAVVGFVAFAQMAPFKDNLFSQLFKKDSSFAAGTATITVTNTSTGTIQTQLSTNNVWSGMVDETPGGQAKLNSLKAPYIRIHVGDDSGVPAMPEIKQNVWSFAGLDNLVNNVFATGRDPLMNIKFAPDWQWTCAKPQTGQSGTVRDLTFQEYAQYMARLVSYYNKGTMTTETGTIINNPAGTSHKITYWEPWNEPDLNNETPCAPANGNGLTPAQFVTMWNAVTPAMRAVDPTIQFVGPATAGSQFGSSTTTGNQYVDLLMTNGTIKPAAISFHSYGYWDNTVTDKWIFDGDNSEPAAQCCGGVTDFTHGINSIRSKYPTTPIWLTEVNVNADWGADTHKRPWSEFAAAWWGTLFQQTAPLGAGIIHHYDVVEGPQFGLFDDQSGNPFMTYYVIMLLDQAFPPGSTILSGSSSQNGILSLAVRKPDNNISVMVINRQLVSNSVKSNCGAGGVAATVTVNLQAVNPTAATIQQLDKNNINCTSNASTAPAVKAVNLSQPINIDFPGYGLAILNVTTGGSPAPSPSLLPSPSPSPSSSPSSSPSPSKTPSPLPSPSPQTSPTPSPAKPGDIDGNNKVDIFDFNILLTNFGKTGTNVAGDLDKNGKVDIFDFNILLTNFGK